MTLTNKTGKIVLILILVGMFLIGCAPVIDIDDAVSGTMTALANEAEEATATPDVSEPTIEPTIEPTATEEPTPTSVPTVEPTEAIVEYADICNLAEFYGDVTIPDGMYLRANTKTVKTWRFKNMGTCAWLPGYRISLQNTAEIVVLDTTVYPGGLVEMSYQFTTPDSLGENYVEFSWYDDQGRAFIETQNYNHPFYMLYEVVDLGVVTSTSPRAFGSLSESAVQEYSMTVGSYSNRNMFKAFAEFSLYNVQPHGNVIEAFFTFPNNTYIGNPFDKYGCVRAKSGNYLNPDYTTLFSDSYYEEWSSNSRTEYIEWCSPLEMATHQFSSPELTALVRKAVRNGRTSIQFKFTFGEFVSGNPLNDYMKINDVQLWIVTNYP